MTLCQLTDDMKENIKNQLIEMGDHINMIIKAMEDPGGCLLCKITGLRELAHEVEALASFFHFQSSLFPIVEGLDEISRVMSVLSKKHHGALIAVEQKDSLEPYIMSCSATGSAIDAKVSSSLLQAIFYPGNPLHDGAVIIRDGRIISAGCVFPLSNQKYTREGSKIGTRHRAALGLSELTDAIVIVVSEETGEVSLALDGVMHPIELNLCENYKK